MEPSTAPPAGPPPSPIGHDDRRWLHDKYERLSSEEAELAGSRTSYYAAIGTVLITGLLLVIADLMAEPLILAAAVSFLSLLGILISVVWAVLLHRTNDAQSLWREAALRLEQGSPPLEGEFRALITLRSGENLQVDLFRPFETHAARFSPSNPISWMDRVDPSALTEILPISFLGIWTGALVLVWVWYLLLR